MMNNFRKMLALEWVVVEVAFVDAFAHEMSPAYCHL